MEIVIEELVRLRTLLSHHPLFAVGLLLIFGYFIGKLVAKIRLPEITGFIIAGLLLGETFLGVVHTEMGESLRIVTEVALGFIALTIGGEFYLVKLKRMGKEVVIITLVQIATTFGAVALGLIVFGMDLPFALMLGAIASATAPAATVAIVQSLRARGLFIDYLYGVVALDDAGAVILFGVVFALATGMLNAGGEAVNTVSIVIHAIFEVILSILVGIVIGFLIHLFTRKRKQNEILIITVGMVFIGTALAITFHLSPLLTNMAAGAIIINMSASNHRIFRILEPMTPPIYALFFVIAGTELQPGIIFQGSILMLGLVYILVRAAGKYGGVVLGGALSKTPSYIKNNLGWCMLPQAGVAIGLVLLVQASPFTAGLAENQRAIIGDMVNIVLFSVFINELVGPPLSKHGVVKGAHLED
ncbi:MAG: cation:proton antiporter [Spirochaetia bacterium]